MSCVLCESELDEAYQPISSLTELLIHICKNCGFIQSTKKKKASISTNSTILTNLSCDADYSNIRVGKQQMTKLDTNFMEKHFKSSNNNFDILDMASARGDFLFWASNFTSGKIYAIEPDEYMTVKYRSVKRYNLLECDYREVRIKQKFDIVYSCHTLEHYRDTIRYFEFVKNHLKPNGYFYLNVPNTHAITNSLILDEFFYDKHLVYFDKVILNKLFEKFGFSVSGSSIDDSCIRYLVKNVREINPTFDFSDKSNYSQNIDLIRVYRLQMHENRKNLPSVVNTLHNMLDRNERNIIVGAGRLFDAFVRYGALELDFFSDIIDNYLSEATRVIHGRNITKFGDITNKGEKIKFVILSRTSNASIKEFINRSFVNSEVIDVCDLFIQRTIQ